MILIILSAYLFLTPVCFFPPETKQSGTISLSLKEVMKEKNDSYLELLLYNISKKIECPKT
jgi:hypothetical protein